MIAATTWTLRALVVAWWRTLLRLARRSSTGWM